ncbi:hypothetical protein NUW54_g12664 [Trametes sanguinea]|uniref:Uncharacterized protein n=1 Tax=Trametes sanguinea TaxID=158606 RepID=A0ACC1MVP8_9APHY|nr:hypothetical protein NUW54_g12664 [Trametes sanguinea]
MEKVRAMLIEAGLPRSLWGEAVLHATWLKNRTSTKALGGRTPFEAATGSPPDLRGVPIWGSKVWVHSTSDGKLGERAKCGRWVGFDAQSQGQRDGATAIHILAESSGRSSRAACLFRRAEHAWLDSMLGHMHPSMACCFVTVSGAAYVLTAPSKRRGRRTDAPRPLACKRHSSEETCCALGSAPSEGLFVLRSLSVLRAVGPLERTERVYRRPVDRLHPAPAQPRTAATARRFSPPVRGERSVVTARTRIFEAKFEDIPFVRAETSLHDGCRVVMFSLLLLNRAVCVGGRAHAHWSGPTWMAKFRAGCIVEFFASGGWSFVRSLELRAAPAFVPGIRPLTEKVVAVLKPLARLHEIVNPAAH